MQQALAQMHALTRPAEPQSLPPTTQQRTGKASKDSAAAASSTVSGVSSGEQRARKASLEGLYSLLAALQGIMSSDAYLKVRGGEPAAWRLSGSGYPFRLLSLFLRAPLFACYRRCT